MRCFNLILYISFFRCFLFLFAVGSAHADLLNLFSETGISPGKIREWRDGMFMFMVKQKGIKQECTAFFIAPRAFVTAYHCVEGVEEYINADSALILSSMHTGHRVTDIIDVDKELDVAIIGVKEEFNGVLPLLKMDGTPEQDELLYSVGYPKGHFFEIIGVYWRLPALRKSYLSRSIEHSEPIIRRWNKLLSNYQGISGAPVFNLRGVVVGMIISIVTIGSRPAYSLRFVPVKNWSYLINKNNLAVNSISNQEDNSYFSQILRKLGLN